MAGDVGAKESKILDVLNKEVDEKQAVCMSVAGEVFVISDTSATQSAFGCWNAFEKSKIRERA